VSLLQCAATVILWVRSYRVCDRLSWTGDTSNLDLIASRGRAELSRVTGADPLTTGSWPRFAHYIAEPREVVPGKWGDPKEGLIPGVHYARGTAADASGITVQVVALPHYFVAALTLALPAGRAVAGLRSRRFAKGLCLRCGYDLRATPDRCPECGTARAPR
jgi:hypothetical protein